MSRPENPGGFLFLLYFIFYLYPLPYATLFLPLHKLCHVVAMVKCWLVIINQ